MDYANRVKSARAYLMAAELMLEHPISSLKEQIKERGEKSEVRVLKATGRPTPSDLISQASRLSGYRAPGIKEWATEISNRAKQQVRTGDSDYSAGTLTIAANSTQSLQPRFRGGRISRIVARTAEGVSPLAIQVLDRQGVVLAEGKTEVDFEVGRDRTLRVTVSNSYDEAVVYELLVR